MRLSKIGVLAAVVASVMALGLVEPAASQAAPVLNSPLNGIWAGYDNYGHYTVLNFAPMGNVNSVFTPGVYTLNNVVQGVYQFSFNAATGQGQIIFYPPGGGIIVAPVQFLGPNKIVIQLGPALGATLVRIW